FQIIGLHFLHTNYCKTHLFSTSLSRKFVMTNRRNLHVKYSTLYYISIKCVLCEAVGSADQNHKTFKTFLFITRKKKQKNLTSAISAKREFIIVARLNKTMDRSYFPKHCAEKSTPKTIVFYILSVMFFVPKAVLSKIKICSTFGFPGYRTKPLKITKDTRMIYRIFCILIKQSSPIAV